MRRLAVTSLLLLSLAGGEAHAGGWTQFLDKDGVRGYTRTVAGSNLVDVRSTIVVPAKIEIVGAVLRDVEGLKRAGSSCIEARIIEKRDRNHYTFYVAYDFPWPVSDRDAVVKVTTRYDLNKARVIADLRAIRHPKVPPREGRVRITKMTSQFVVEYISRNKTGVVYTSRADPGGSLPSFLVNRGSKGSLKDNAGDLRLAARNPKYVKAARASPDTALVEKITKDPGLMTAIVENRLREFISDRKLAARLARERWVLAALTAGSGKVGEILLHGWGSYSSKAKAVRVLLRRLLGGHTKDRQAIERFVADRRLIGRILYGKAGDKAVAAFIARHKKGTR
jgi:hypothetical protein